MQNSRYFLLAFAERNTATMTKKYYLAYFGNQVSYVGEMLLCNILDPWSGFLTCPCIFFIHDDDSVSYDYFDLLK